MVLHESLRFYPPAPMQVCFYLHTRNRHSCTYCRFPRECARDYTYKGLTIPKGVAIHIPGYLLHMKPEYWKEPEKFDPLRYVLFRFLGLVFLCNQPRKRDFNCLLWITEVVQLCNSQRWPPHDQPPTHSFYSSLHMQHQNTSLNPQPHIMYLLCYLLGSLLQRRLSVPNTVTYHLDLAHVAASV